MRLVYLLTLLLLPLQADAAPLYAAVASWLSVSITTAAIIVNIAITVGMTVYGSAQQRKAAQAAKDAYNESLQDRTITRVATEAPIRYVYGKARVGSDIVAILTSGDKDQYKHLVCVHASHECEAIEEVYINGKALGTLDADGFVTSGDYAKISTEHINEGKSGSTFTLTHTPTTSDSLTIRYGSRPTEGGGGWTYITPVSVVGKTVTLDRDYGTVTCSYTYTATNAKVRVKKHLGNASDVADASLIAEIPSKWDSTKTLTGLCYTVVRLDLNEAEFQGGIPSVEVLVKGKKLYDFRTGVTAWSDNPALAIYDYLTSEMCGVDKNDLPKAQFITAANVCEERTVPTWALPGFDFPRYTINGTVTSNEDQKGVLERMAQCMAGSIVSTTWDIYAGKYIAPVMVLDQSDIVGTLSVNPGISDADLYNGVRGQYVGAETNYVADDFKAYQNNVFVAADGVEKWTNIDFHFTDTLQRVHNLCRIFTEDQRNGYTVKAEFSQKTWKLKVGDRVTLTSTMFGWDAKVFRVTDKKYSPTSAVELTLKEDAESIWDFSDETLPDATPNTNLPNPFAIDMLSSLTVTSGNDTLLLMQDGTIISRILTTWPQATTQAVVNNGLIEVEWSAAGDGIWQKAQVSGSDTQVYLSPVEDNVVYNIRARCVNPYFNVKSDWLYVTHQVIGKTQEPPDVTGFAVTLLADATRRFTFNTDNQPVDVTHGGGYRIKYRDSTAGTAWASMIPLHDGLITTSPFDTHSPDAGTYDFAIVAVDGSGNESANAEFVDNIVISDTSIASSALAAANAAQSAANTANAAIANITSDNVLSKGEKSEVILDYSAILNEKSGIDSQADAFGVSRTAYDAAITALTTYLTSLSPAYDDTSADTTIVGSTFRTKFSDVYSAKQSLLNSIYAKAKTLADAAQGTANTAVLNAAAAQGAADAAQTSANTANNLLVDIASDSKLTPVEKSAVRSEWNIIAAEVAPNDTQATTFGITTEKTAYDNAFQALATYLNNGTTWVSGVPSWISDANLSTTTTIVGSTFRNTFKAYYDARTALLNAIAAKAKTLADAAQGTANAVAADFNASNNRNGAAIAAPTIATDGTAIDHTLQKNGSADISFEWSWGGVNGDIDGFLITVYQSSSSSAYTFGTTPSAEQVFTVPANKRAFILFGAVADQYYSFAVQAYRSVDKAINSAGVITSTLVKATGSGENPYQPSTNVAFSGNVTGTVDGINASDVNQWGAIAGAGKPADNATVGATFGVNISGAITSSNSSTYIGNDSIRTTQIGNYAVTEILSTAVATTDVWVTSGSSGVTVATINYTTPANVDCECILTATGQLDANFPGAVVGAKVAITDFDFTTGFNGSDFARNTSSTSPQCISPIAIELRFIVPASPTGTSKTFYLTGNGGGYTKPSGGKCDFKNITFKLEVVKK